MDQLENAIQWLNAEKAALKKMGVRDQLIDWILIQDYMESAAFTNEGTRQNNPGNIMWNRFDRYGSKGTYNAINKTYYSRYPTLQAYLNKKIQVLNQKPGVPANATSSKDFVDRLAMNQYFGKITPSNSVQRYYDAMKGAAQRINLIGDYQTDANQKIVIPKKEPFKLPWYGWAGIGVLALIIIKKA